jgi:hypothetical protein
LKSPKPTQRSSGPDGRPTATAFLPPKA